MICVKELVENFGDLGHGAQSIYGYQSLTLYCDMKSANLDLRNREALCVLVDYRDALKVKLLRTFDDACYLFPADQ